MSPTQRSRESTNDDRTIIRNHITVIQVQQTNLVLFVQAGLILAGLVPSGCSWSHSSWSHTGWSVLAGLVLSGLILVGGRGYVWLSETLYHS